MARVRFTADFDYSPTARTVIGYLAGMELTVKRDCANQVVAAGKATEIVAAERSVPNDENPEPSEA